jgi:hypothetical protein
VEITAREPCDLAVKLTFWARLYRNFGRANQSEELIDLEVLPGNEGERRIGRITIGAK